MKSHAVGSFVYDRVRTQGVSVAETAEDLNRIGALRYALYVARDKKSYPDADHHNHSLIEAIDHRSLNVFGEHEGECLTAIRLTKARLATDDRYLHRLLENSTFDEAVYDTLAVVSRLTAAEHAKARPLMISAMREAYRVALRNEIKLAVAATRQALVPFFIRLGWVSSGKSYAESIAGEMHILVLDLHDRSTLNSECPIFLDLLDAFEIAKMMGETA
jgi:predicted GNAT family N-acyltransferase